MRALVYGPAYLDQVVEIDGPLVADPSTLQLDQSLPALRMETRTDDRLVLLGPTGDELIIILPPEARSAAATYYLSEPVLARRLGGDTERTVQNHFTIRRYRSQIGGMGAGYAKAFQGTLRMPLGHDAAGQQILDQLTLHDIAAIPSYLPCASDPSLVILSSAGDKLAVGVREAMVRWRATEEDRALVDRADLLVFCGAPNALMAEVLGWQDDVTVMCAPAMRNVSGQIPSLAEFATRIDYLTLNALEWAHLDDRERCRTTIPVITVTDGPRGSHILLNDGHEFHIPALPCTGAINTNRAGETYGSTFCTVLLRSDPRFHRTRRAAAELALRAGHIASAQAARQLRIAEFAFPPDDWIM